MTADERWPERARFGLLINGQAPGTKPLERPGGTAQNLDHDIGHTRGFNFRFFVLTDDIVHHATQSLIQTVS